jgi:hypothetical protein
MTPEQRVSLSRAEDEHEKKAIEDIRVHGIHWLDVFDRDQAGRGFCYSVGLWHTHNHPEVIIFGLKSSLGGRVLNGINNDIGKGKSYQAGLSSMDILEGFRCYFETFPKGTIFLWSRCYGQPLQAFTPGRRRRTKSSRIFSQCFRRFRWGFLRLAFDGAEQQCREKEGILQGLKPASVEPERPKAKALGYLDAKVLIRPN